MGPHRPLTSTFGRRAALALIAALAIAPAGAVPAAAGDPTACVVSFRGAPGTYGSLAAAVPFVPSGATVRVRGICTGTTSIATSMTVRGVKPDGGVTPVLDGAGGGSTIVVSDSARVTIVGLTIRGGTGTAYSVLDPTSLDSSATGGNIAVAGARLVLRDVRVEGGSAVNGASLAAIDAQVRLLGSTQLIGGTAYAGGGVALFESVLRAYDRTTIRNGSASGEGGGIIAYGSGVWLYDRASVRSNTATLATSRAGGISLTGSTLTIRGRATVRDNLAPRGGGIDAVASSAVYLGGAARITGNTASGQVPSTTYEGGGGVSLSSGAVLYLGGDASIDHNTDQHAGVGAGLRIDGATVRVQTGSASTVKVSCGSARLAGYVHDNAPEDCVRL